MKLENTYLSDEELEQLIADVEQNELVAAPPDLMEGILTRIENMSQTYAQASEYDSNDRAPAAESKTQETNRNKIKEFRGYCFRVLTSVAAAVAIVFLVPGLGNMQPLDALTGQQNMMWESTNPEPEFPELKTPEKYATKEEVLNDTGIFRRTFGGTNIFDNDDKFNIFNGRDGG